MLEQSLIGREEDDDRSLADDASTPEGATQCVELFWSAFSPQVLS
jgi:hypothetical protein